MKHMENKPTASPERDTALMKFIARYRVATNEVFHKRFFAGQQPNAVTKVTLRLCRSEHLRKFPLWHPRTYFTLGPVGAQQLGLPVSRTRPLGPQSLPTEYGVLSYATRGQQLRKRLTSRELLEQFPDLPARIVDQPWCQKPGSDPATLELVRVDLGGKPDHVARKCAADISEQSDASVLRSLMRDQRLSLVIVTGTTAKAASIQESLGRRFWPDGLQIRLAVVPDLLPLIARTNDGT